MLKSSFTRVLFGAVVAALALVASLSADHSWGPYQWARQANPFTLTVVDSTTVDWDDEVTNSVRDWSVSSVLDMRKVEGSTDGARQCKPPSGQIRICNLTYGFVGWVGLAGITIDPNGHITTGYTKLNDSYLNSASYSSWRQGVVCQEVGHDIGLDHQDEDFDNDPLKSCMDYQDPLWPTPNAHDYDQLEAIYAHLDSYNSYVTLGETDGEGGGDSGGCNAPPGKGCNKLGFGPGNSQSEWGISLGRRGRHEKFIRIDADGTRHITFVTWADGH